MKVFKSIKASEMEAMWKAQTDNPPEELARDTNYFSIVSDCMLGGVPLDASSLSFSTSGMISAEGEIDQNLLVNIVTGCSITKDVILEVSAASPIDKESISRKANSFNVTLSIVPDGMSADEYAAVLMEYADIYCDHDFKGTLLPYDGYAEYAFARELGHTPNEVTTDPYMKAIFMEAFDADSMDAVKVAIEAHLQAQFAEGGLKHAALSVAAGIYSEIDHSVETLKAGLSTKVPRLLSNYEFAHTLCERYRPGDEYLYAAAIYSFCAPLWDVLEKARSVLSLEGKESFASSWAPVLAEGFAGSKTSLERFALEAKLPGCSDEAAEALVRHCSESADKFCDGFAIPKALADDASGSGVQLLDGLGAEMLNSLHNALDIKHHKKRDQRKSDIIATSDSDK